MPDSVFDHLVLVLAHELAGIRARVRVRRPVAVPLLKRDRPNYTSALTFEASIDPL